MRKLEYTVNLDGDGYTVMSYAGFSGSPKAGECLPIRMSVLDFQTKNGAADILKIVRIPYSSALSNNGFRLDCNKILNGQKTSWIPCHFNIRAGGIRLGFFNSNSDEIEEIDLVMALGGMQSYLNLQFSVPHHSGKPDTTYKAYIRYGTCVKGDVPHTEIIVSEMEQLARRTLLFENKLGYESMDDIPVRASVTEYTDL